MSSHVSDVRALADAAEVRDHWWPRPGWRPGRLFYTWHITFDGAHPLHDLVSTYQEAIAQEDGVNLIPLEWLHLTVQGVGYMDEIPETTVNAVTEAVGARLESIPPVDLTFSRPVVLAEAIALSPSPVVPLHTIRSAIRAGISEVFGEDRVHTGPEQINGFRPHISIAYINSPGPADPYISSLARVTAEPVAVQISDVTLIIQNRILEPEWIYRWNTLANS